MLRVELKPDHNDTLAVRLEGRLVGRYAEDASAQLALIQIPTAMVVDLSEVTYVDPLGEQVLLWLGRRGAKFVAVNVYTRSICERLHLKVSEQRSGAASEPDRNVFA